MLYQELPPIDSTPLDGWGRWLAPALIAGAALTAALLLLLVGQPLLSRRDRCVVGACAARPCYRCAPARLARRASRWSSAPIMRCSDRRSA